jgi:hypothetical protein
MLHFWLRDCLNLKASGRSFCMIRSTGKRKPRRQRVNHERAVGAVGAVRLSFLSGYVPFFRITSPMERMAAASFSFCSSGVSVGVDRVILYPRRIDGASGAFETGVGNPCKYAMNWSGLQ